MKKVNLLLLASLSISQAALAANLTCDITRTNKYNDSDIATHSGISKYFDPSERKGRTLVAGSVRSHLLPSDSARVNFGFEVLNRQMETRLALETLDAQSGSQVVFAEKFGSIASAPEMVSNEFDIGKYRYNVDCSIQDDASEEYESGH